MATLEHEPLTLPEFHINNLILHAWSCVKVWLGVETSTEEKEFRWLTREKLMEDNPDWVKGIEAAASQIEIKLWELNNE